MSVEWAVQATEFANCNCAYGCGCQFNALPDKGFCEAVAGYQVTQGHFGDVQLDGLRAAAADGCVSRERSDAYGATRRIR
jgi:hypothetical protein